MKLFLSGVDRIQHVFSLLQQVVEYNLLSMK